MCRCGHRELGSSVAVASSLGQRRIDSLVRPERTEPSLPEALQGRVGRFGDRCRASLSFISALYYVCTSVDNSNVVDFSLSHTRVLGKLFSTLQCFKKLQYNLLSDEDRAENCILFNKMRKTVDLKVAVFVFCFFVFCLFINERMPRVEIGISK